ncbi:MAG: TonB family protein [Bradymonadia bacterium]|jgi:TonB family protein
MTLNGKPSDIAAGVIVAMAAHVFLGAMFFFAGVAEPDVVTERPLELPVLSTELLMLGEQMPTPGELPRIANPEEAPEVDTNPEPTTAPEEPTAAPDQETVVLNPEPREEPPEEREVENRPQPEERQEREVQPRRDRGETNPNRPTNDDPTIGSPEGFEGGTSLSASAVANQLAPLTRQISGAVRRPNGIPDNEYRRLRVRVEFRVSEIGRITRATVARSSGNRLFDNAVVSAFNSFRMGSSRLQINSITNEDLRNSIIRSGGVIEITGR